MHISSIIDGCRRVGWLPYLRYRLLSRRRQRVPMRVRLEGHEIWVRTGTPDLRVAFQSLGSEFDALADLLPADFNGLLIDAGGYIGTAAIKLAEMYPRATIVSIEPSTANFEMLRRNITDSPNIHPVNAALHPSSGERIGLVDRGTGDWGFTIALDPEEANGAGFEEVETISLAEIARRFPEKPVGLVKLDIEGGEQALLGADDPVLQSATAVFAELHDRIVPDCTGAFRRFSRERTIVDVGGEKLLSLRRQDTIGEAVDDLGA